MGSLASFFSPLSSSIYFPALDDGCIYRESRPYSDNLPGETLNMIAR